MQPSIRTRTLCAAVAFAFGVLPAPAAFALPPHPLAPGQACTFPSDGFAVNRADGSLLVVGSQAGGVALGPGATFDSGDHRIIGNVTRGAITGTRSTSPSITTAAPQFGTQSSITATFSRTDR